MKSKSVKELVQQHEEQARTCQQYKSDNPVIYELIKQKAKIQEEYDTEIYEIKWDLKNLIEGIKKNTKGVPSEVVDLIEYKLIDMINSLN